MAAAHAGLHAARLPTPYVTLRTRLPGFAAHQLRAALQTDGSLIKLRTCRRTLHIYPVADAAAVHAATLRQRLGACAATVRRLGYDPALLDRVAPAVRAALATGPIPSRALECQVLATRLPVRIRRDTRTAMVRLAIKWLWESGELTYRNTAASLHQERREYQLTEHAHPGLLLTQLSPATAIPIVLRRYLAAFGPASIQDFQWWSGLTRGEIAPAIDQLRPELLDVRLDEHPQALLMLAEQETALRTAQPLPADHVTLLAYEDPTLKGFHATRHRYVEDRYRNLLFNSIGEARASIAVAGRCIGTWQFNRATRAIEHQLHTRVPAAITKVIAGRVEDMTDFLRTEPC